MAVFGDLRPSRTKVSTTFGNQVSIRVRRFGWEVSVSGTSAGQIDVCPVSSRIGDGFRDQRWS